MMEISDEGVAFIKRWEGLRLSAYRDVAGVWSIGYGHTVSFRDGLFDEATSIDEAEADVLLRQDLRHFTTRGNALVRVPLNQNEFDALVSFDFNTGGLERATALTRLNAENRLGAAEALTWWNKARIGGKLMVVEGLARRRAAEAGLFLRPLTQCREPAA